MLYLALQTNVKVKIEAQAKLFEELTREITAETGRPESEIMLTFHAHANIQMSGKNAPAAFVDFRGMLPNGDSSGMSSRICKVLQDNLGVTPDRVYLNFTDVQTASWNPS